MQMSILRTSLLTISLVAPSAPLAAQSLPDGNRGSDSSGAYYIDNVDEPPARVNAPALRYPTMLYRAGVEGQVLVEFVIDESGRANRESIRVVDSSNRGFIKAAEEFVRGSEYSPALRDGKPVSVVVQQQIQFKLSRSGS